MAPSSRAFYRTLHEAITQLFASVVRRVGFEPLPWLVKCDRCESAVAGCFAAKSFFRWCAAAECCPSPRRAHTYRGGDARTGRGATQPRTFARARPPNSRLAPPPSPSQSSGVTCTDECMTEFNEMKIRSAYRYIIFKITDDKKSIVIESKGDKNATFDEFKSKLPDGDCRYAVLDVEIATKSGATANKLIFVAWSDDNASVKPKMLYASSKDALKKTLTGINEEYQATDRGDLDEKEIKKKAGHV